MESFSPTKIIATMKYYSPTQFAIFRTIFGFYLMWHFYSLIPYGPEIFGSNGMIPDPTMIPTWGIFPSFLHLFENDYVIKIFLGLLSVASFLFAAGFYRNVLSVFLWYGWVYLINRNVLISNPGIPYVGWLLLACALIPSGEGFYFWRNKTNKTNWYMPGLIYWSAWFLMALGYTISGLHKLQCPSWIDGSALRHILSSLLARDNFMTQQLLAAPNIVLQIHTWFSLMVEILFLPLGIFYRVRKWYWMLFIVMHLGIMCLINFTDLTLGVLMIHFFTFDNRWLNEFPFVNMNKFFCSKEKRKINPESH